jgi:hypothetical protein
MYLLEALDFYQKNKDSIKEYSEFEILCRVHLTGILDLGCIYLRFWEIPSRLTEKNVRAVYLRTIAPQEDYTKETPPKNEQYYIPGGLPSEIVILLTIFTRAHFVLSRALRQSSILLMIKYASDGDVARGDMDGKTLALGDIKPYFDMIEGLKLREISEKDNKLRRLEPFMLAARFYHLALSLIHKDDTIAYISLVSAIEALLHDYDIENIELEDWNEPAAKLMRETLSEDKYQEVKELILVKPVRIKNRFINFIKEHLTDKFWSDSTRPNKFEWARFSDISDIEKYLSRIYDARSSTLHEGKPLPPSIGDMDTERPLGLGIKVGWQKEWKEEELIPPVRAFERIVHHVLLEYLRRESQNNFSAQKVENAK